MEGIRPPKEAISFNKPSSQSSQERWRMLARALLKPSSAPHADAPSSKGSLPLSMEAASRRPREGGFTLISRQIVQLENSLEQQCASGRGKPPPMEVLVQYSLPGEGSSKLLLRQRAADSLLLRDMEVARDHNIDSTGVVGLWAAEEVLAYYAATRADLFRGKRIVELGAGYGLAGLTMAACTEASEVLLTDGNPQVVETLRHNVEVNGHAYGSTQVGVRTLHWSEPLPAALLHQFDLVVAADCTFFKEFHTALAATIKGLLRRPSSAADSERPSEAAGRDTQKPPDPPAAKSRKVDITDCHASCSSGAQPTAERTCAGDGKDNAINELRDSSDPDGTHSRTFASGNRNDCRSYNGTWSRSTCGLQPESCEDRSELDLDPAGWSQNVSRALLFAPPRGNALQLFGRVAQEAGLQVELTRRYDSTVWALHESFAGGRNAAWPGYEEEHCYPLLMVLSLQ